jgi:TM2 domain-containing membrane protein YozV
LKRKSKFVVFLLSLIPGLGHFYLGFAYRGMFFLGAAGANILLTVMLVLLTDQDDLFILLLGLPVIWFIAVVDGIMLADRHNREGYGAGEHKAGNGMTESIEPSGYDRDEIRKQNKKILTCLLSVVPGAGHMYLGYQRQGLELMTMFFFMFFFIDWLRISFFMFIIPVIWFYSMFDALGKAAGEGVRPDREQVSIIEMIMAGGMNISGSKALGYSLVGIGLLLIFDRIISPLISYQIRSYLQTGIVSFLFIYGGIRILTGGRREKEQEGGGEEICEDGE